MHSQQIKSVFIECLSIALRDEEWRAFIRARLEENELPVIELNEDVAILSTNENA
jgi:hypothetical protein